MRYYKAGLCMMVSVGSVSVTYVDVYAGILKGKSI